MFKRALCAAMFFVVPAAANAADLLYISEYSSPGTTRGLVVEVAQETSKDSVTADFTSAAVQSNAFAAGTNIVRLWCNVQCSVAFGTNPTATASSKPMAALTPEYFAVPAGQSFKVSVHTNP